jgi:tetratricopeptide (TPR) repeat protein
MGDLEGAKSAFRKAIEVKPDFYPSVVGLAQLHLYAGEHSEAEKLISDLVGTNERVFARYGQYFEGVSALFQGQFARALELLKEDIKSDDQSWEARSLGWNDKRTLVIRAHWERGEYDLAIEVFDDMLKTARWKSVPIRTSLHGMYIQLLVEAGMAERAAEVAEKWKGAKEGATSTKLFYFLADGILAQAHGDLDSAALSLAKATEVSLGRYPRYLLGSVYLDLGEYEKAASEYMGLIQWYSDRRMYFDIQDVKSHYFLARAQENLCLTEKAIYQYENFLYRLRNAETGIREVEDAKERLAALKSSS